MLNSLIIIGIIIFLATGSIMALKWMTRNKRANKILLTIFRSGNTLCCGHKGCGKDMLFSHVITCRERDGEVHAANIAYTDKTIVRPPQYYTLNNNSYEQFISGNFAPELKKFREKEDYYISEAGLCLPSWMHSKLEKHREIKNMPIVFALSRQLASFNIHANAQSFNRIWDKLREQADYFIWCERCRVIKLFKRNLVTCRYIIYSRAESALSHIMPYEGRKNIFGRLKKDSGTYATIHNAKYGYIERFNLTFFMHKNNKYNTRDFYIKLYNKEPPEIKTKEKNSVRKPKKSEKK